jgi:hypothetical protein
MTILLKKVKYLNNRDLLDEIHKSKCSFSSFISPEYTQYDLILGNLDELNIRTVAQAKRNRAKRIGIYALALARSTGNKIVKLAELTPDYKKISKTDVVIRIMTFDHIPKAPGRKKSVKTIADAHEKVNFPPFQHWKFDENSNLVCVGKSHWKGPLDTGKFFKDHGRISENLGKMFIKLSERYAQRSNWRGYCVDAETEALTKRGWVGIDDINETDTILSYSDEFLKWSSIKSIYRGEYDGLMHKLTNKYLDSLITPNHKIVCERGLVPIEFLLESDRVVLMGKPIADTGINNYSDKLIELVGWVTTDGNYERYDSGDLKAIRIYQNNGAKADRIRDCLNTLGLSYSEKVSSITSAGNENMCFYIHKKSISMISDIMPDKDISMDFITSLTSNQREILINTMVDGDGWRTGNNKQYIRYTQKNKEHIELFQVLCTLSGRRSKIHKHTHISFGKKAEYYNINVYSTRKNKTKGDCINLHGGKRNGREHVGSGKVNHQNEPTTYYKGMVWCPETEYGCFIARRNGTVFLTGNTYVDEMRGQALLQLSQIGLQFDESKSSNPFAYFTAAVTNSFTKVLNIERKSQNIRDDLLEYVGLAPSLTRQNSQSFADDIAKQAEYYKNIVIPKSEEDVDEEEV